MTTKITVMGRVAFGVLTVLCSCVPAVSRQNPKPVDVFARWQRDNPAAAATIVTATASLPEGEAPASDEELKRLRRIAGLENGGSNE
jgi:hypothetical protein